MMPIVTEDNPNYELHQNAASNQQQGPKPPPQRGPKPPPGPPPPVPNARLERLQKILDRFEITIAEANDLVILEDFEMVVIADDSGSMNLPAPPPSERKIGLRTPSRWDELRDTVSLMVDLGCCFDKNGIDVHFLNRASLEGVQSSNDPRFVAAFQRDPNGRTPLTTKLREVVQRSGGEKPVLLFILTDGVPDDGPGSFREELRKTVKKESTSCVFKIQIIACTGDDEAIGYLNEVDRKLKEVDVTDDYYSERVEVMKAKRVEKFTRGDWCLKSMLGPVSTKFDHMDEARKRGGEVTIECVVNSTKCFWPWAW
jgi:hypothetical protein